MRAAADGIRGAGLTLGLVPTMGFFHEGHVALMRRARGECARVAVSLFVNPTQFGPAEDLARYPRALGKDKKVAADEGVDVLFVPEPEDIYPAGYATFVDVERLRAPLCGARRPGHFRGVATVVTKLFQICRPTAAYFGRKDYQQSLIVKRLAKDLDFDVEVKVLPTVREPDGLAMSSRNSYLSPEERRQATCLFRALVRVQALFGGGERRPAALARAMADTVNAEPAARLDYAEVLDADELAPVAEARAGTLAAIAAFVGPTRLIDNTLLGTDVLTGE